MIVVKLSKSLGRSLVRPSKTIVKKLPEVPNGNLLIYLCNTSDSSDSCDSCDIRDRSDSSDSSEKKFCPYIFFCWIF